MSDRRFTHKDRRYQELEAAALAALAVLVGRLRAGDLSPAGFGEAMAETLEPAHQQAAAAGRAAGAGSDPEVTDADRRLGSDAWERQKPYLAGFVDDLEAGCYDDDLAGTGEDDEEGGGGVVGSRADLYGMALLGTAMAGWVGAVGDEDPGTMIEWRAEADACEDCSGFAAGGPYAWDELPAYPGGGSSRCLSRCRCDLEAI